MSSTDTTGRNAGRTLSPEDITKLLSDTRTRGDYGVVLDDFYKSGEPGIEVEMSGNLAGKDATNVYTGLNNAKKAQDKEGNLVRPWGPQVKVIKKNFGGSGKEGSPAVDEHVFLINTSLVEGDASAPDEATETQ
jgi:hypothetical protein